MEERKTTKKGANKWELANWLKNKKRIKGS
jgi:hypothetical protein